MVSFIHGHEGGREGEGGGRERARAVILSREKDTDTGECVVFDA